MGADLAIVVLLGGIVALDGTSFGQFMISRPFIAGTLTGAAVGSPMEGAAVGAVLEMFQLCVLPVGGARFPEAGPAAVVATLAAGAAPGAGGLALACVLGLVWAEVCGASVIYLRLLNGRMVPDPAAGAVTPQKVMRAQFAALVLDFLRGALLVGVGAVVGILVTPRFALAWPLNEQWTLGLLAAGAAAPLGALLRTLGGLGRWRVAFTYGLVVGCIAVIVR